MPFQITSTASLLFVVNTICGLVRYPQQAALSGNNDPTIAVMRSCVNLANLDLGAMRDWQRLIREGLIDIYADAPGQQEKAFDLPVDWLRFIDQTSWDRTARWPSLNAMSAQHWQSLLGTFPGMTLNTLWRVRESKFWVQSPQGTLAVPHKFHFEYVTAGSVIDADDPTLLKNIATKDGDTFLLNGRLLIQLGRAKYLETSGYDASAARRDFLAAYDEVAGNETPGRVLLINAGVPVGSQRMIDSYNVPDSSFGS
jgi:hypothetical protein